MIKDKIVFKYSSGGFCPLDTCFTEKLVITPEYIDYQKCWTANKYKIDFHSNDFKIKLTRFVNGYRKCYENLKEYLCHYKMPCDYYVCDGDDLDVVVYQNGNKIQELGFCPCVCEDEISKLYEMIAPFMEDTIIPDFLVDNIDIDEEEDNDEEEK